MSSALSINPATGEMLRDTPWASPAEVDAVVEQAASGWQYWRGQSLRHRAQKLRHLGASFTGARRSEQIRQPLRLVCRQRPGHAGQ